MFDLLINWNDIRDFQRRIQSANNNWIIDGGFARVGICLNYLPFHGAYLNNLRIM